LGRDPHELVAVPPVGTVLVCKRQKCLVDQRRGLKGVAGALVTHIVRRWPAEFPIDKWNRSGEGILAAEFPFGQQKGGLPGGVKPQNNPLFASIVDLFIQFVARDFSYFRKPDRSLF
jgi:hypothetical protein